VSTIEPGCSTHHQNAEEQEVFLKIKEVPASITHLPKEKKIQEKARGTAKIQQ
jgi:hypothetical protein